MKKFVLLVVSVFALSSVFAREYNSGIGGRVEAGKDGNYGVTYKHFFSKRNAFEGMFLSDFSDGVEGHLFYEYQALFPGIDKPLYWYGGAGHIGFWGKHDPVVAGIDGLIGMEYLFPGKSISLGLDWHPLYNVVTKKNKDKFHPMKFGISVRYVY